MPTYRVTIEGVTWEQFKRILEICPLAEAEKERLTYCPGNDIVVNREGMLYDGRKTEQA